MDCVCDETCESVEETVMAKTMKKMMKKPSKSTKKRKVRKVPEGALGTGMAEGAARSFRERDDFLKNI